MRAVILKEQNQPPVVSDTETPEPQQGEVLVRVQAAALNHRDVWIMKGQYPNIQLPLIPGSDGAGTVVAEGDGVSGLDGKEVIIDPGFEWGEDERAQSKQYHILGLPSHGTFAEYVRVPADHVHEKPQHLTWEQAAALPLGGVTAFRALFTRAKLQEGERLLVTGAGGGVAQVAIQLALAAGAEVWVTSGSDSKIDESRNVGVKGGANYREDDWDKQLKQQAKEFDVVLDSAGGKDFGRLLKLVKPGGRIAVYGGTQGTIQLNPAHLFWRQISILGSTMGSPEDFAAMLDFVNRHQVVPKVDEVFTLDETAQAFTRMERGQQTGKIVLNVMDI